MNILNKIFKLINIIFVLTVFLSLLISFGIITETKYIEIIKIYCICYLIFYIVALIIKTILEMVISKKNK